MSRATRRRSTARRSRSRPARRARARGPVRAAQAPAALPTGTPFTTRPRCSDGARRSRMVRRYPRRRASASATRTPRRAIEWPMSTERWTGTDDADFREPFVDVDEWRDAPVRHRYVHGAFAGTETRFSIYLPPADQYDGRFFQHIT